MRFAAGLLLLAVGVLMTGCGRDFFHASGALASEGNWKNTWRHTPQGCSRDPSDGLADDRSRTVVALLWEDPQERLPPTDWTNRPPDAPLRLEFFRAAGSGNVTALLQTVNQKEVALDASDCAVLTLETAEQPARGAHGRPTLAGKAVVDCRVPSGHISGSIRFERCQY